MTESEWYALVREDPRAANALVAEEVMGKQVIWNYQKGHKPTDGHPQLYSGGDQFPLPDYLRSGDAMLEVVEKMHAMGWWCRISSPFDVDSSWCAGFTPLSTTGWNGHPDYNVCDPSVFLAVCTAALKALGVVT